MSDNVTGAPNRGHTYHGGTPASIGRSTELEGLQRSFADHVKVGNEPNRKRSSRSLTARLVRNVSGVNLKPGRIVRWKTDYRGRRTDGYTNVLSQESAGVVDPWLPAAGVANNDLFWVFVEGPVLIDTINAGEAVALGDVIAAAVGTSETNDDAGRLDVVSLAAYGAAVNNNVGRAMTAHTAGAKEQVLVDLKIKN